MKRILPFILVFILASSQVFGQTVYNLSFINGLLSGGQLCIDIQMSFDAAAKLGSSNLYFTYDKINLSSPTITTHTLSGSYATPTLTTPADGRASFNIVLNNTNNGIPIATANTQIARICFNVADENGPTDLTWITSGTYESIVFLDNEATLLGPGTMANYNGAAFPVEWLSFNGKQEGADAILDWSTASEINNKKFEIERSVDGQSFEIIGDKAGKGNTTVISDYSYVDRGAGAMGFRKLYYRLRQVDYDGTFDYSPTIELGIVSDKTLSILGYPNPFNNELRIRYTSIVKQNLEIEVLNAVGQKIYAHSTREEEGDLSIDVSRWAQGVYYLSIRGGTKREVYKVLKEY